METLDPSKFQVECAPFCLIKPLKDMGIAYYKAKLIQLKANHWHMLINNTDAIKKIYSKDYWDVVEALKTAEEETNDNTTTYIIIGVVCGVVVIIGIVIVVILIKRRNYKSESLM